MSPDLPVEGRPDDFRSTYYVAFKRGVPAKVAAFGAQRHISTGATLRIRLSDWLHGRLTTSPLSAGSGAVSAHRVRRTVGANGRMAVPRTTLP